MNISHVNILTDFIIRCALGICKPFQLKKEHSVEECPLHFDIDRDGIPILVEIGLCVFNDFIALIKGQPLHEERRGILADVHEPGNLNIADLPDRVVFINPNGRHVDLGQRLVEGFGFVDRLCLFQRKQAAVHKRTLISDRFSICQTDPADAENRLLRINRQFLSDLSVRDQFNFIHMHVDFITLLKQLVAEAERGQSADHLLLGNKGAQSLNPGNDLTADHPRQIGLRAQR